MRGLRVPLFVNSCETGHHVSRSSLRRSGARDGGGAGPPRDEARLDRAKQRQHRGDAAIAIRAHQGGHRGVCAAMTQHRSFVESSVRRRLLIDPVSFLPTHSLSSGLSWGRTGIGGRGRGSGRRVRGDDFVLCSRLRGFTLSGNPGLRAHHRREGRESGGHLPSPGFHRASGQSARALTARGDRGQAGRAVSVPVLTLPRLDTYRNCGNWESVAACP